MCEGALAFAIPELANLDAAGRAPERGGELLTGGAAQYSVYRTKDDRFVSVGPLEPKFWAAFNAVLGRRGDPSELIGDRAAQEPLRRELAARFAERTRDEWEVAFAGSDACVEPVLGIDELAAHPQHRARGVFFDVDGERYLGTPFGGGGEHRPPPGLGDDSAAILGEAGLSAGEIAALRAAGVTR
jgi:alpha-methylacyl-CoA racemase